MIGQPDSSRSSTPIRRGLSPGPPSTSRMPTSASVRGSFRSSAATTSFPAPAAGSGLPRTRTCATGSFVGGSGLRSARHRGRPRERLPQQRRSRRARSLRETYGNGGNYGRFLRHGDPAAARPAVPGRAGSDRRPARSRSLPRRELRRSRSLRSRLAGFVKGVTLPRTRASSGPDQFEQLRASVQSVRSAKAPGCRALLAPCTTLLTALRDVPGSPGSHCLTLEPCLGRPLANDARCPTATASEITAKPSAPTSRRAPTRGGSSRRPRRLAAGRGHARVFFPPPRASPTSSRRSC